MDREYIDKPMQELDPTHTSFDAINCVFETELKTFFGQPKPIKTTGRAIWDLVMEDMSKRNEFGKEKYGTALQAFNGRDVLQDAYEEALDLCVYLRQAIEERK